MAECLIMRRGGETHKVPVLNPIYPQDVSTNIIMGETTSATFNVEIHEHGNPSVYTYQWYVDGNAVSGATGESYTMEDLADAATHEVYCEVTNRKGTVTSRVATLTVTQSYAPTLDTSYPQDVTVTKGESVTSEVAIVVEGSPAEYTYQWYKDGAAVDGANSASYTFTPSEAGTTTLYCEVANSAGKVTSRTATITAKHVYLYEIGDQHTDKTGGWGSSGWFASNGTNTLTIKAPTIDSSGITINGNSNTGIGLAASANKIDLSNVNTLYINVAEYSLANAAERAYFAVHSTKRVTANNTIFSMDAMSSITKTGEIALNVENINSGYVVAFIYGLATSKIRITGIREE